MQARTGRGRGGRAGSARELAYQVLRRVSTQEAFATLALGAALDESGLPVRERRLATELVYGVSRHQRRLDRALAAMTPRGIAKLNPAILAILRVGAYELLFLDRIPDHASVSSAVQATRRLGGDRLAGFVNGVLRRLAREGEPPLPPRSDLRAYVETAFSLPGWIVDRLAAELAAEAPPDAPPDAPGAAVDPAVLEAAAAALSGPAPLVLRVNRLRCDRETLLARLRAEHPDADVQPSPWAPGALVATGLGDPERSPSFVEGLWTVQDLGAQLVGHLVAPEPGWHILDACAGVGGKSTHLAELADNRVRIDAADISDSKLGLLRHAAARLGTSQVTTQVLDLARTGQAGPDEAGQGQAGLLADHYDAILLDAPCTGLGVLRRHPEAKERLREPDVARMAALQRALLDALAPRVRPGGLLVYSVCTFTREEGPAQVAELLARQPGFALEAPGPGAGPMDHGVDWAALAGPRPGVIRTWPHVHGADAFFMARLRRQA